MKKIYEIYEITTGGELDKIIESLGLSKTEEKNCRKTCAFFFRIAFKDVKKDYGEFYSFTYDFLLGAIGGGWRNAAPILKEAGILEFNGSWSNGGTWETNGQNKSGDAFGQGYRLKKNFLNATNFKISLKNLTRRDKEKIRANPVRTKYALNLCEAKEELVKIAVKKRWKKGTYLSQLEHIMNFNQISDDTEIISANIGRAFNKVNCMPQNIRLLVRKNKEQCAELDMKSCSFAFALKFTDCPEEKELIKVLVESESGGAYEHMMKETGFTRKQVKNLWVIYLGGERKGKWNDSLEKFAAYLTRFFPVLKSNLDSMGKQASRAFMKLESGVIVDDICKRLDVVSIHDGILCLAREAKETQRQLEAAICKALGVKPVITIKTLGDLPKQTKVDRGFEEAYLAK